MTILKNIKLIFFLMYITIIQNAPPAFGVRSIRRSKSLPPPTTNFSDSSPRSPDSLLVPGNEVVQANIAEMMMQGVSYGSNVFKRKEAIIPVASSNVFKRKEAIIPVASVSSSNFGRVTIPDANIGGKTNSREKILVDEYVFLKKLKICKEKIEKEFGKRIVSYNIFVDSFKNRTLSSFSKESSKEAKLFYETLVRNASYHTCYEPRPPHFFCKHQQMIMTAENCLETLLMINVTANISGKDALEVLYLTYEEKNWSTSKHFKMTDDEFNRHVKQLNGGSEDPTSFINKFRVLRKFFETMLASVSNVTRNSLISHDKFCRERIHHLANQNAGGSSKMNQSKGKGVEIREGNSKDPRILN